MTSRCKTCGYKWTHGDGEHDCWDIVMAENARLQNELNTITTAFPGLRQRPPSMPGDNLLNYIRKAEQLKKQVAKAVSIAKDCGPYRDIIKVLKRTYKPMC